MDTYIDTDTDTDTDTETDIETGIDFSHADAKFSDTDRH